MGKNILEEEKTMLLIIKQFLISLIPNIIIHNIQISLLLVILKVLKLLLTLIPTHITDAFKQKVSKNQGTDPTSSTTLHTSQTH